MGLTCELQAIAAIAVRGVGVFGGKCMILGSVSLVGQDFVFKLINT